MNLRDLSYVVMVAELKNFTLAAEKCSITQSTLSIQIKKVENLLGVSIFVRGSKNGVLITEVGEKIIPIAKNILNESKKLRIIAEQSSDPYTAKLSLGAFPSVASYVFPEYIFKIKQHYPDVKLQLIEEKTNLLIDLLKDVKLDAALIAMPLEHDWLEHKILFEDPFTLAVSSEHPLAQEKVVDLSEIENEKLLLLDEEHCLRAQILHLCNPSRFVEHNFRASSLETLRYLVKYGLGVTLMPSIAIEQDEDIKYLSIRNQPNRSIALVWRKDNPRRELLMNLSKLLSYKPML
jgi:LysR family hydrogen peroxide-inducible transcriptional activator